MVETDVMAQALSAIFGKETVFFGLFLWMFWKQQKEKDKQNEFILQQQQILQELSNSIKDISASQNKIADRLDVIETHVDIKSVKG